MPRTARILFPSRPREREDFRNAIYGRIKVLRRVIRSPTSLLLPLLLLLPFPLSLLPPFTYLSPQLPLTLPHPYIRRDNEDTFVGIPRTRNSCYVPDTAGRPVNAIMPMLSITYPRQQLLRREPGQVTARSPRCFSASRLIEFTPVPGVNVRAIMETRRWKKKGTRSSMCLFSFFSRFWKYLESFFFNSFHGGWLLCWWEKRITVLVHGFLFSDCSGIVYSSSLERRRKCGYKRTIDCFS